MTSLDADLVTLRSADRDGGRVSWARRKIEPDPANSLFAPDRARYRLPPGGVAVTSLDADLVTLRSADRDGGRVSRARRKIEPDPANSLFAPDRARYRLPPGGVAVTSLDADLVTLRSADRDGGRVSWARRKIEPDPANSLFAPDRARYRLPPGGVAVTSLDADLVTLRSADRDGGRVSRARRKIEPDPANSLFVQTVRGIGYRLVVSP